MVDKCYNMAKIWIIELFFNKMVYKSQCAIHKGVNQKSTKTEYGEGYKYIGWYVKNDTKHIAERVFVKMVSIPC